MSPAEPPAGPPAGPPAEPPAPPRPPDAPDGPATRFPHLLSPLRVGPMVLTNRVVLCAHLTGSAQDGLPTAQHAAYYGARAAGGVGMVVTEEHAVHPGDRPYEKVLRGYDPAVLPGYRRITDAVHAHGVPVLAQLNHNGGASSGTYTRLPVWAPSAVPDPLFREVPLTMERRHVEEVVAGFAAVAARCSAGGFDGVELQCAHSSLLGAFLSPATNRRTDGYGAGPDGRRRLLLEVVTAVREALGPGRALGVRLCGDDLLEGGTRPEDAVETARALEATGSVDYLSTAVGTATSSQHAITPGMRVPAGYALDVSRAVREAVALPVLGVGRLSDPEEAERALAQGDADLVGVVRGQVAEPDLVALARAGRSQQGRRCLACNQQCVGRVGLNQPLRCVVNPRAGREAVPLPAPRRPHRRVLVVGGGPAGLQAARTAAERGHLVTLLEAADRLGGQVRTAARAPGRAGMADLVDDLEHAARRAGARLRTGCPADAATVLAQEPDVVVLATGAVPVRPGWAGGSDRVVDVRDVLDGRVRPGGRVVVVDELGFHQATSVAELLAGRGCDVEITTDAMVVGQDLGLTLDLPAWSVRAEELGIRRSPDLVPLAVAGQEAGQEAGGEAGGQAGGAGPGGVVLELLHHPTGTRRQVPADWVVCCLHQRADEDLWQQLGAALAGGGRAPVPVVHRVGDCLAPRRADAAVREGHRAALSL